MQPRRARLAGLASAAVGTLLVLGLLVAMNLQFDAPTREGDGAASSIQVVRQEAKKPRPPVRRPPPPRPRPARASAAPPSGLDGGLAGLDFGLPAFDADALDLGTSLLGDGDAVVMSDESVDQPPRPLTQTPMAYPPRAKAQGVTGYVLLNVLVGPTGEVEKVAVLEAQPAGVFDEAAVAGVRGWRFEPASYRGENVRVWARQKIRFDLAGA